MESAKICRLCFSSQIQLIDIFDVGDLNIAGIINEHIGEINQSDALPKCICVTCWKKTEEFHHFHRSVRSAQENYLKQIVKYDVHNLTGNISSEITKQPLQYKDIFMENFNTTSEIFKCKYCGKCFNQKMDLYSHESKHKAKEDKRFPYEAFQDRHTLSKHIRPPETIGPTIPFPFYNQTYPTEQSLECHMKYGQTTEPESVICEICGKQFASQNDVQNHNRIAHWTQSHSNEKKDQSKRSHCTICNASFATKFRLKKHIDSIHLSEPVKCKLCGKVAPNPAALVCHMRSVHVAQNFQCHLCSKAFKAASALKDHIATHTGEKMYKCSFCPEAFIWRPNMYSHQKKAHPNEWKSKKNVSK